MDACSKFRAHTPNSLFLRGVAWKLPALWMKLPLWKWRTEVDRWIWEKISCQLESRAAVSLQEETFQTGKKSCSKYHLERGACVAQLAEHPTLDFTLSRDLKIMRLSPTRGLALSTESTGDSIPLPLPLPRPVHAPHPPLSLKKNKTKPKPKTPTQCQWGRSWQRWSQGLQNKGMV